MDHEKKPELRLAGDSFSQELVDEGLAGALDVAQTLAEKYHLPLVDLGVAGVDAEAVKMIALPVLNRVVAVPFASEGSTLKVAITNPQDVRGLDELRLATRLSVEFYVAARSDVLTELRRLSRAAEAMNASFADEIVLLRLDMDVARPVLGGLEDHRVVEADERRVGNAVVGLEVVDVLLLFLRACHLLGEGRVHRLGRARQAAQLGEDVAPRRDVELDRQARR